MALVGLTRFKDDGRPLGLVGAVGIVLGLQAETYTLLIDEAFLSRHCTVKEVAGINLDTRFIGVNFQGNAG